MTKKSKVEPANLTEVQKQQIFKEIMKTYPQLIILQDELRYAIDQYSQNKNYIKDLMKNGEPVENFLKEAPETGATMEIIKQGTPEYEKIMEKFQKNAKMAATIVEEEGSETSCNVEEN